MMTADSDRNILVIYLSSPASIGKSALMLTLKYLRRMGWSPTVLTLPREGSTRESVVEWNGLEILALDFSKGRLWRLSRAVYRARARSARGMGSRRGNKYFGLLARARALPNYLLLPATAALSFPDPYRHTVVAVMEAAHRLHRQRDFKAVLSMYDPMTSHIVARKLAMEDGLPWIALTKDYYSKPRTLISSRFDWGKNWIKRRYEKAMLSKSTEVLTVYDDLSEYLSGLLPDVTVTTLTHSYDDDDHEPAEYTRKPTDGLFRVLWLGTVQGFDREYLQVFFKALGEMVTEGLISPSTFRARFVGPGVELARSFAGGSGCEELLEMIPSVPHEEAMKELKQATCLLFTQQHIGGRRRMPEFIATRKPILVYPPEHGKTMSDRVLRSYGAAAIVEADSAEIKSKLSEWYRQFQTQGRLEFPVNEEIIHSFSASRVAATLDRVLQEATSPRSGFT